MAGLESEQFKDYRFRVYHDPLEETVAVVAHVNGDEVRPMGSLAISHAASERVDANHTQRRINAMGGHGLVGHSIEPEAGGQYRWHGGNMDPHHSEVGWAGVVSNAPGRHRLVQGLAALAVAAHGSMPVADSTLSQHGARLARGMSRKYGMQGGKYNPEMSAGFNYDEITADAASGAEAKAYWRRSEHEMGWEPKSWTEHSAADVGRIAKGVDDDYRVQKRPDRVAIHPDQQKLF